jgi:hypothetical protein
MATHKQALYEKVSQRELAARLHALQSPDVQGSLERLRRKYGRHAVPVAQVRAMLDEALGERPLTQELYALRDG